MKCQYFRLVNILAHADCIVYDIRQYVNFCLLEAVKEATLRSSYLFFFDSALWDVALYIISLIPHNDLLIWDFSTATFQKRKQYCSNRDLLFQAAVHFAEVQKATVSKLQKF